MMSEYSKLIEKILSLPRRIEPIGGQNYSYLALEDVTGLIESLKQHKQAVYEHEYAPEMLSSEVIDGKIIITIRQDYIINSVNCGITTGMQASVNDKQKCLQYYSRKFVSSTENSAFNTAIDKIAIEAVEDGELWIDV